MKQKELSRSTNPPHLRDYHRLRLYPRYWDMSSLTGQNGHTCHSREERPRAQASADEELGACLSPKAFEEWQIGRHYPADETYRCDTFAAF